MCLVAGEKRRGSRCVGAGHNETCLKTAQRSIGNEFRVLILHWDWWVRRNGLVIDKELVFYEEVIEG